MDLDVTPTQIEELTRTNRKPAVIYTDIVIYDICRRWDVGDFVHTSFLHKFDLNTHW
ncbi:DUF6957 family protein [Pseudomonas sp. SH1-B]